MGKWARNMREQSPINSICSFKIQISAGLSDVLTQQMIFLRLNGILLILIIGFPRGLPTPHTLDRLTDTGRPTVLVTARSPQVLSDRCVRSILQCLVMSGKSSLQCHEMSAVLCDVCSILRHLQCHKHSAVSCNGCSFTSSLQCQEQSAVS